MRVRKITDVIGLKAYTDSGEFFGEVEEANLQDNRVDGWRVKVGGGVVSLIGGARGVIIPHQFVKAISDVFIINKTALPTQELIEVDESVPSGDLI
ncbi:MAG: PRC-barrel domain-containing protein [Candidatus Pacearchaeota archaeon]|nr:PRC-barrel domain-containing protein [Candidatus Pacearchaeota archaeon]